SRPRGNCWSAAHELASAIGRHELAPAVARGDRVLAHRLVFGRGPTTTPPGAGRSVSRRRPHLADPRVAGTAAPGTPGVRAAAGAVRRGDAGQFRVFERPAEEFHRLQ